MVQQGNVNVTITPMAGALTTGSGVTLASVQLAGTTGTASISVLPITFSASGAGSISNLTNCRIFNSGGTVVSGAVNPVSGVNAFAFNSVVSVPSTTGTQTYSLRCDIATSTPSGTSFQVTAGTSVLAPGLEVNLNTAPSVPAGSTNVALANIMVGAENSNSAISITSIPVAINLGNGVVAGNVSNCRIRGAVNTSANLSSSATPSGGTLTFTLAAPLIVTAGSSATLSLACDVSASTPVGGTISIAITPSALTATNVSTGAAITPTASVGFGPNGLPASTSGTVIVSSVDSAGEVDPAPGTGTPGVPNTGLGGNAAMTLALLLLSALVALGGVAFLRSRVA